MGRRIRGLSFAVAAAVAGDAARATLDDAEEDALTLDPCTEHLQTLVLHLQDKGRREGAAVHVEWQLDGCVVLHYEDFSQRMCCRRGELVVDFPGFTPLQ